MATPVVDPLTNETIGVLEICNPENACFDNDLQFIGELSGQMLGGVVNRYNMIDSQIRDQKSKNVI